MANQTTDSRDALYLIQCITIPLSTAIILANLLIIIGIVCNQRLHNTTNYFFLSLLVADLLTGVALPYIPKMSLERELDFHTCLLVHIFPNFLFLSFLFNLVMVHYERYLCIIYPLHYKHFWAHRFFPLALLAVWLPPLLYASLPAFGWNNRKAIAIGNITNCSHNEMLEGAGGDCSTNRTWGKECSYKDVFPHAFIYLEVYGLLTPAICSIVFMTVRVLWIAREQLRDICKLHRAVQRDHPSEQEHRLNIRYVRCVVAVSLTFLVCWVPYIIYMHVSIIALSQDEKDKDPSTYIILSCTGIGSMAIIPAILGLGNRQYTEPVMNVCGKLRDRCRESKDTEDLTL